jgi:hypothetical protein
MIAPADEASPTRLLDHCPCCGGAAPCGNRSHAAHRSSTTAHDAPTFGPYRPANIGCRALRPEPHASPRQHRPHASPERRQQRRSSGHDDRSASCRARTHSRSAPPRHRGTLSDRRLGPGGPATIPIARPRPPGLLNPASMRSRSHLPSTFVSRDLTEPSRFRPGRLVIRLSVVVQCGGAMGQATGRAAKGSISTSARSGYRSRSCVDAIGRGDRLGLCRYAVQRGVRCWPGRNAAASPEGHVPGRGVGSRPVSRSDRHESGGG